MSHYGTLPIKLKDLENNQLIVYSNIVGMVEKSELSTEKIQSNIVWKFYNWIYEVFTEFQRIYT